MTKITHTPGPWHADNAGRIWRRHPSELYENGGGVAGDKPVATANIGWIGEDVTGYPIEANARLIAAAPELLEALQMAAQSGGFQYMLHETRDAIEAAIAKATGE